MLRTTTGILIFFLTCQVAWAGRSAARVRKQAAAQASEQGADEGADTWSQPAAEPETSASWDPVQVLDGQPPPPEVVEASAELAEERGAELTFLNAESDNTLLEALAWYRDPLAYVSTDPLHLDHLDLQEFDLPIRVNDDVKRWMRYFLGRGRVYYTRWLGRRTRYAPMIEARLAQKEMPQDLLYLSMIESGFNAHAYSTASAVGLWQFISSTGRAYNLRVDWWIDERRDPELATEAALQHLQDLHKSFGDWYLAAAAYNAGAGRIRRALSSSGAKDYWALARPGVLPEETRNYVPKIIAAAIIGHHPERYGFRDIEYEPPLEYDKAQVPGATAVAAIARCTDLEEEEFLQLNAALRRWATPPEPATYEVRVTKGSLESFQECMASIPPSEALSFHRHVVARGESLGAIARRYGVDVTAIAQLNSIANVNRIYVGMELVVPVPGSAGALAQAPPTTTDTTHTVRKGETLNGIATHFGVPLQDLMQWNNITDANHIVIGQRLIIRGATPAATTQTTYKIKRGDSLSRIAQKYDVTVEDLKRWNRISNPSKVQAGQVITIYSSSRGWSSYSVHTGDTLGTIAQQNGCTVAELKAWNSLDSNTIYPGQTLKLKSR